MPKVLIVDDETAILELFRYVFEDAGYAVALAKNGKEAMASVVSDKPDFIVLDVAMPVMSGKEFAIELKRRAAADPGLRGVRFVVMTGENFMDAGLNTVFSSTPGFVCYFPKMIPPEKVLEKAGEVLGQR
ncbi:MAG: response regulator [Elusimicrobia bacterium]|nr:response regulator [Elusimicrobiota bacterium]